MSEISLKCSCSTVQGVASQVTPKSGVRILCYCDDCQAFARFLDQEKLVLDEYEGTDIYQMPIANVRITQGKGQIRCMRLSHKGMFRW